MRVEIVGYCVRDGAAPPSNPALEADRRRLAEEVAVLQQQLKAAVEKDMGTEVRLRRLRSTIATQEAIIVDSYSALCAALGVPTPTADHLSTVITATAELGRVISDVCRLVSSQPAGPSGQQGPASAVPVVPLDAPSQPHTPAVDQAAHDHLVRELEALSDTLAHRDDAISRRDAIISEKDGLMVAKDRMIADLEQDIKEVAAELSAAHAELTSQRSRFEWQAREQSDQLSGLHSKLLSEQQRITALKGEVKAKAAVIAELREEIENLRAQNDTMYDNVQRLQDALADAAQPPGSGVEPGDPDAPTAPPDASTTVSSAALAALERENWDQRTRIATLSQEAAARNRELELAQQEAAAARKQCEEHSRVATEARWAALGLPRHPVGVASPASTGPAAPTARPGDPASVPPSTPGRGTALGPAGLFGSVFDVLTPGSGSSTSASSTGAVAGRTPVGRAVSPGRETGQSPGDSAAMERMRLAVLGSGDSSSSTSSHANNLAMLQASLRVTRREQSGGRVVGL